MPTFCSVSENCGRRSDVCGDGSTVGCTPRAHHARQLLSWRTYVVRYPVWAMAAALGAGIAASTGLKPARLSRRLGFSLVRYAFAKFQQSLLAELWRLGSDLMSDKRDRR